MSSLLSLYQSSGNPMSWTEADIGLQRTAVTAESDKQGKRLTRDFTQYNLPDLLNSQAARGAYNTSATQNKVNRLQTAHDESQDDINYARSFRLADLQNRSAANVTGGTF